MKKLNLLVFTFILLAFGCGGKPIPMEIKEVCKQPIGTNVEITGYISLPKVVNTIQLRKGGAIKEVGLQLFMMTKQDATGDAVMSTFWTTPKSEGEPNKIKPLPMNGYTWNDLLVYTNDGKSAGAGKLIKISGVTTSDEKNGCGISVAKIELPQG
jgi:hypothetical protein